MQAQYLDITNLVYIIISFRLSAEEIDLRLLES